MIIFPAIDLRGGNCVRLFKGDFSQETVFSDQPAEMALKWESMGAEYLHLVDLDGALAGKSVNRKAVQSILSAIHIPAELGGGIRTMEQIEEALQMGLSRVILGSAAVRDPELVGEACARFGEKIVVGIDARDGIAAVQGWEKSGGVSAVDLAKQMGRLGVKTLIYTDISRDGTLSGINIEATVRLARESGLSVVASGGVSSLADVRLVKSHEKDGLAGVIIGKALYSGTLDLKAALEIAAGED